ncbi:P2X purinoceptor 3 isoform X1 [Gorilla gorilla gorilla]|uniref:P2X purinoceptor 3 isoform X1 n=1 Tax=Gorilla gorilla gorilla TaxID=9595 RepID=UPI00300A22F0
MNCISDFFTYETTKSVVVKSWTIGIINRVVQLLIISYFVGWVFLHEKAYQVRDTAIESSVVTKVKGSGLYANRVMDVSDYVTPPQGTSVFVIITKMIVTENQMQGFCPESEEKYRCVSDSQCGPERFPGGGILTGRCVNYSSVLRTCEIQGWCPTEVDTVETPIMMEAENFTIFIKNSIRFPLFNFEKGNLLPNLTARDMKTCRFHPDKDPFCPILRVGDVVKFAGQDFAKLARTGGVLGIKIGWVCDLDKAWDQCIPKYSFTRLDSVSEKSSVSPGYNFRFAKYYKMENGSEYRTLMKAFGIRFDVLVYGNAGKFNIIPTIISSVAAFTSVGVVLQSPWPPPCCVSPGWNVSSHGELITSGSSLPIFRRLHLLQSSCFSPYSWGRRLWVSADLRCLNEEQSPRGMGTVLCDIILLNFLKGADQYKAKKFEEVNETTLKIAALTNPVYPSDQTTAEKQSTDSGAFSIGH